MSRWIFGIHPVSETLKGDGQTIDLILVKKGKPNPSINELIDTAKERGIKVRFTDQAELNRISGKASHQGVALKVTDYEYTDFDKWFAKINEDQDFRDVVVLDGVTDPHNLGAILRSADAFAAAAVIIPKDRSVDVNETVMSCSAGALNYIPVIRVVNLARTLEKLKEAGYWVAGAAGGSKISVFDADFTSQTVFVLGSEGKGIRPLIKKTCDFTVSLPMSGGVESLNVSVAGGILLAESYRQKLEKAKIKSGK